MSLLGLQYYFSHQWAISAANNNFSQSTKQITQHLQEMDSSVKNMLYFSEYYPDLDLPSNDPQTIDTIKRFTHNIVRMPNVYALYVGRDDGDMLEVVNMNVSPKLVKHFNAPLRTRWTIVRVYDTPKGRVQQLDFLDNNLVFLSKRVESTDYSVTHRPWFIQAKESDKAIRTDPYLFANIHQEGITFAKTIGDGKAVLAIDFTLDRLNTILRTQKSDPTHEIVMFGRDETIVACSSGRQLTNKLDVFMKNMLQNGTTNTIVEYEEGGVRKFVMVTPFSKELSQNTYLGMSIDAGAILHVYMEKVAYSLLAAFGLLLLAIPLVYFMTSRFIRPISALMVQNEKVKERHFDDVKHIDTNIIEFMDLSQSMVEMSESIWQYQRSQAELMDSFIQLLADAIDAKSPYTGGHCRRVPRIALALAKVVQAVEEGTFKEFKFENEDAWREFQMGAWLHDCGKVTTPEYVVDKATKLETIYNRIHEVRTRFEVIWRDIELEALRRQAHGEEESAVASWQMQEHEKLISDFEFIAQCNIGGEFMSQDKQQRVADIAKRLWTRHFDDRLGISDVEMLRYQGEEEALIPAVESLLGNQPWHIVKRIDFDEAAYAKEGFKLEVPEHLYNYGEIYNLCIEKGTLSAEERFKIQEHVIMTIKMLERLPYPATMKRIPEYAGTHHETLIGTGYPKKLTAADLSIPARIMVIADIFEALSASDRPYKKGKSLSEALGIMNRMRHEQHIDAELFALFLTSGVYLEYALEHLKPEQIDEVDIHAILAS
jgi:HD-GYP domain-containing protein (c-di-GMP phosphodiesterase class II)